MADTDWTDDELRPAIIAYRQILDADISGKPVSPTAIYRELMAGPLQGRSEGAIGRRMSNLSSVFLAEGLPVAARFRGTLGHVGTNVTRRILTIYAGLYGSAPTATADDAILKARVRNLRGKVSAPPAGVEKPAQQETKAYSYCRDPSVCAYVLDRAKGICEACGMPAPFTRADGEPFLEVHHVVHLAEGGPDTIDNAIAACPNCHRRLHHGHDRHPFREAVLKRRALRPGNGQ